MTDDPSAEQSPETPSEPPVPQRPPDWYPGIGKAIGLLVVLFLVQAFLSIPFAVAGLGEHPAGAAAVNLASAAVLLAWVVRRKKVPLREMLPLAAVSGWLLLALLIAVVGLSMVLSEVDNLLRSVLPPPAWFSDLMRNLVEGRQSLWGSVLAVAIIAPLWEEALFRGVILRGFLHRYRVGKAVVASALLFGMYHLNPWQFAGAFVSGLLLAWCFVRTGSLVPCIFGHAVNNSIGFVVRALGVTVPGYSTPHAADVVLHQPIWFDAAGVVLSVLGFVLLGRALSATGGAASGTESSSLAQASN